MSIYVKPANRQTGLLIIVESVVGLYLKVKPESESEYAKGWGMGEKVRKPGIETIEDISWGTHICQFCRTEKDLIEVLIPYFRAGLENNEFCIWATSEHVRVEDAKKAFKNAIPDFNIYLEKGQIEIIPYSSLHINEGVFGSVEILWNNDLISLELNNLIYFFYFRKTKFFH